MPPKGIAPNLFGERKVFIGTLDGGAWHEFVQIDKPNAIFIEPTDKSELIDFNPIEIKLNFRRMKVSEDILRLFGICKFRKPRKTTYKTLRHDCAKRNGRR